MLPDEPDYNSVMQPAGDPASRRAKYRTERLFTAQITGWRTAWSVRVQPVGRPMPRDAQGILIVDLR